MKWTHEDSLTRQGHAIIAGLDEVGRGSLAGPVVAAAVILDRKSSLPGVRDSKLLSEKSRRREFGKIALSARAYSFGVVDAREVDRINILEATRRAMESAINSLPITPDALLVDAVEHLDLPQPQKSLIHGDRRCLSIAAASILAKVFRDEMMTEFDSLFPGYSFHRNKGYGTLAHRRALNSLGPSALHRKTFGCVIQPSLWEREA